MNILENAIHLYNTTKLMSSKSGSSSIINYKFFPFMSSVTSMFFSEVTHPVTPPSKLDSLLASWKMKRLVIEGDGNCCFSAVAQGLVNLSSSIQMDSLHQTLISSCPPTFAQQLRCIAVEEWQKNAEYYSGFLVDCYVVEEAQIFCNRIYSILTWVMRFCYP